MSILDQALDDFQSMPEVVKRATISRRQRVDALLPDVDAKAALRLVMGFITDTTNGKETDAALYTNRDVQRAASRAAYEFEIIFDLLRSASPGGICYPLEGGE